METHTTNIVTPAENNGVQTQEAEAPEEVQGGALSVPGDVETEDGRTHNQGADALAL